MEKKLFLIDGSALAYRSFFAFISNPLINSRGENTSAVFGFLRAVFKIEDEDDPAYMAVVFDTREPTFRHKAYAAYKATREKMPEDMRDQIPKLKNVIKAMNIPLIEAPGFEADDVLATLAIKAEKQGIKTYIATADKDMMQVVTPDILLYNLKRSGADVEIFDPKGVKQKMGVPPEQIVDYLALVGDTSDNVPGVPRVGAKTAVKLLEEFGSLEGVLENVDEVKGKAVQTSLRENVDQAKLSQDLVTLELNAPVELDLEQLSRKSPDAEKLIEQLRDLEFNSLIARFQGEVEQPQEKRDYQTIKTRRQLDNLVQKLEETGHFTFDLETTSQYPMMAEIVGFSFSVAEGEAFYVPVKTPPEGVAPYSVMVLDGEEEIDLIARLGPLLTDASISKNGQNAKYDILVLKNYDVIVQGLKFDTMLASYLLNPGAGKKYNLDALALEHFNLTKIPTSDLIGKGKKQITMREVPEETVAEYACEDADVTERLRRVFEPKIKAAGLTKLAETIEIPLVDVLVQMEYNGIALDLPYLEKMSHDMAVSLGILEKEIYALAGGEFNINSTKQLGKILFEDLKLPVVKKTKTGYSTDASVLEKLAKKHPLPEKLVEYREITKLKSTYVDSLPKMVNPRTKRIHTSYNQTIAATGRLSSSDPNLQNIPIRTEMGRQIRRAFVPGEPGWKFLAADYSQIELRVMAHLSNDPGMAAAFNEGRDIHSATASEVFGVPKNELTSDHRRKAKEINFGIIYGISAYGLASRLNISRDEAQSIIAAYFVRFPNVNQFIIDTIANARADGYVTTLMGRKRYLPDLTSKNFRNREFAERIATNSPIQGTAADMIKVAMINVQKRLEKEKMQTKMLLQVHDELVFETPESELEKAKRIVAEEMENAVKLNVPVKVDIGVGDHWLEAH